MALDVGVLAVVPPLTQPARRKVRIVVCDDARVFASGPPDHRFAIRAVRAQLNGM